MIRTVSHVCFVVSDLEGAVRSLREVL